MDHGQNRNDLALRCVEHAVGKMRDKRAAHASANLDAQRWSLGKPSAGTPCPLNDAAPDFFPRRSGVRIGLKFGETPVQLRLQLFGYRNRFRYGGNTVPDQLNQADAFGDGQFENLGDGYLLHVRGLPLPISARELAVQRQAARQMSRTRAAPPPGDPDASGAGPVRRA